jgi:arylsulfatase A-like enzyme
LLAPFPRTPEVIRQHIADYYGMISHLDAQVGRVLEALDDVGQADNTIVVYTADHGLAVGQHGLMGKQNMYEHSVHVPAIVRGPGLPRGQRVAALAHTFDLYPTICQLTGAQVPATVESRNLLPLLSHAADRSGRDSVHAVYRDVQRMVSDGRWKLIVYSRSESRSVGVDREQLFDLQSDPCELTDRSADEECQSRLEDLRENLRAWQHVVGDPLVSS